MLKSGSTWVATVACCSITVPPGRDATCPRTPTGLVSVSRPKILPSSCTWPGCLARSVWARLLVVRWSLGTGPCLGGTWKDCHPLSRLTNKHSPQTKSLTLATPLAQIDCHPMMKIGTPSQKYTRSWYTSQRWVCLSGTRCECSLTTYP